MLGVAIAAGHPGVSPVHCCLSRTPTAIQEKLSSGRLGFAIAAEHPGVFPVHFSLLEEVFHWKKHIYQNKLEIWCTCFKLFGIKKAPSRSENFFLLLFGYSFDLSANAFLFTLPSVISSAQSDDM